MNSRTIVEPIDVFCENYCYIFIIHFTLLQGDSGGPLMEIDLKDGKTYLIGIVSFGPIQCGASDEPGAYTKVGAFIPWILNNLIT